MTSFPPTVTGLHFIDFTDLTIQAHIALFQGKLR